MTMIKVDLLPEFKLWYQKHGHPLGKTRRGRKKWLKNEFQRVLRKIVDNENNI